jgi:serine/threonine protein kinase
LTPAASVGEKETPTMESHPQDPWVCRTCGEVAPRGLAPGDKCPRDATVFVRKVDLDSQPEDPILGQVVGGKFAIVGLIGVGGFGAVYRAIQTPVGRVVAVKVIRPQPDAASHDQLRARFFREARVVARLSDPATVTLYDYGEESDGRLYMVFEYIDGIPLSLQLKDGPLPPERVAPLLFQMLGALAEAHRLGCVHRDLKPGNVMLARSGFGEEVVKVLDFGIAKVTTASDTDHSLVSSLETREGVVIGTPKYMAPEQARGLDVDARADIYALGCLAYAMLTGKPPFDFHSAVDVLMAQVAQAPRPLPAALGVPERLSGVVFRALAKDPNDRFQSAEEMARAIVEFTPGLSVTMEQSLAQAAESSASIRFDAAGLTTAAAPPPTPESGDGGTSREMAGALATFSTGSPAPPPHLMPRPPGPASPTPATAASGTWRWAVGAGLVVAAVAGYSVSRTTPAPQAAAVVTTAPVSVAPAASAASEASRPAPPATPWVRALQHGARGEDAAAGEALLEALTLAERAGPVETDALRRRALGDPLLLGALARPAVAARFSPAPTPAPPAPVSLARPGPPARTPRAATDKAVPASAAPPSQPASAGRLAVPEF